MLFNSQKIRVAFMCPNYFLNISYQYPWAEIWDATLSKYFVTTINLNFRNCYQNLKATRARAPESSRDFHYKDLAPQLILVIVLF